MQLCAIFIALVLLSACGVSRDASKSPRAATEQLLLAQAVERSFEDVSVPILKDVAVVMEVAGLTPDQYYVRDAVAGHLARTLGTRIVDRHDQAKYVVHVMVQALGTELDQSFFGMPQVQGGLIPIALPELPLYKFIREVGYVRYAMNIYESATGRLAMTTPWYTKTAAWRQYTIFIFLTFRTSTLTDPPELSRPPAVPILTPPPAEPDGPN
ncbi:MAG: hypothetical protein A3H49_07465 [Nitrospirae bacterium RIFCSPLOWO2_02_FULL_62_14]|nr:MAG: hypothetical protein A3H49_07465 [Nitrospirae bacterium RIFCSPLOWO2_02_FULL_62_14]